MPAAKNPSILRRKTHIISLPFHFHSCISGKYAITAPNEKDLIQEARFPQILINLIPSLRN